MAPLVAPVIPSPVMQPFCKPVSSISVKKLGAYSLNPLKLTKKGPLSGIAVKNGDIVEEIEQIKLDRIYDTTAPKGVDGRSSDNTFIKQMLQWEPSISLEHGIGRLYPWVKEQYYKWMNSQRHQ